MTRVKIDGRINAASHGSPFSQLQLSLYSKTSERSQARGASIDRTARGASSCCRPAVRGAGAAAVVPSGEGGRTVVVWIRRDNAASRELLTWALVKITYAGDCVVAFVLKQRIESSGLNLDQTNPI